MDFVRARTAVATVPLVPEISLHQATEMTELWRATAADLAGWDDSPFWAFPWAGGQALARHLLDHPDLCAGRRVLDFGTGSGLVAIAAALSGAASVEAWDVDPFCEAAVRLNATRNGVAVDFRAGSPLGTPTGAGLVLAGDVFYERELASRFLAWARGLADGGARVVVGDPGRIYSPRDGLRELSRHEVPTTTAIEERDTLPTRVLEILPG
jgi:predicted nicotinamide N-methyase